MKLCFVITGVLAYSILPQQHVLNEELRSIETAPQQIQQLNEGEILQLIRDDVPFIDVTDYQESSSADYKPEPLPQSFSQQDAVCSAMDYIDTDKMKEFLNKFTSFHTRYYKTKTGVQSAEFLEQQVKQIAKDFQYTNVSVHRFEHSRFPQFSIVARIAGTNADLPPVIVGAHQDSVNGRNPMNGRSPGADDDGSGTTSTLEAFRVLSQLNKFRPLRPVEFHFYAAEEAGLLGSMDIAAHYKKHGSHIYAMLQNDMTGYVADNRAVYGIVQDFVDAELTVFIQQLITKYCDMNFVKTKCGYGCSDHASWYKNGYRSAFAIEGRFGPGMSPYIHSNRDTVDTLSFEHMKEFTKLDLAFVIELSL